MKYVALLRGINVGGKNKIDMKRLIAAMSEAGFEEVSTYINSGNIFFDSNKPKPKLVEELERVIESEFGLKIKVLLRDKDSIDRVASLIPSDWHNGDVMKCDVIFLWDEYDNEDVLNKVVVKPGIDDVRYTTGALIWKVDRANVTKSGMQQLVGTDVYAHVTARNCNTVRKLQERMAL